MISKSNRGGVSIATPLRQNGQDLLYSVSIAIPTGSLAEPNVSLVSF